MVVRSLSNKFTTQIQSRWRTITSNFQETTIMVKDFCTNLRQITATTFVRFLKNLYLPTAFHGISW